MKSRLANLWPLAMSMLLALALLPALADAETETPDPNAKFYEMFTLGVYKDGRLDTFIWLYSRIWIDGIRQSDDDNDDSEDFEHYLKTGDVVEGFVCENYDRVLRYRLDRLTPQRADFTRWIYASIKTRNAAGLREFRRGALQSSDTFTLDLTQPNGLLVDYGPNYVVSSGGKTPRSK